MDRHSLRFVMPLLESIGYGQALAFSFFQGPRSQGRHGQALTLVPVAVLHGKPRIGHWSIGRHGQALAFLALAFSFSPPTAHNLALWQSRTDPVVNANSTIEKLEKM